MFIKKIIKSLKSSKNLTPDDSGDYIYHIERSSNPIDLIEINEIISSDIQLVQMEDRKGINPFTQEEVVFSGEGKAIYSISNEQVGNLSLEDGKVIATGIPKSKCVEIANRLKATIVRSEKI